MPTSSSELLSATLDFTELSSHNILNGCAGCLDGWLCGIKVPGAKHTSNIISYFLGHYQCYGLNIQAPCDACCHFTLVSVLSPGGTGDSKAFFGSRLLYDFIQGLPAGFYMIADNAYMLLEHLLIP